jgi:hypothetical protein
MRAMRSVLWGTVLLAAAAGAAELPATVQKSSVDVYVEPRFDAPKVTTLQRNTAVKVAGQQGLWYALQLPDGKSGFVRVNDVRLNYAGTEGGEANLRVLTEGKAGQGRVMESAGVRGIEESELKAAAFDRAQLDAMNANRVDAVTAATYAREQGWQATRVAYVKEAKPAKSGGSGSNASSGTSVAKSVGSLLGAFGGALGAKVDSTTRAIPDSKAEDELLAEELALGPEITGRVLGARPLWADPAAQRRVNLVGRWVASQTSRPDLPWTFGVIDTPEVNAFAAPGGYVLVTRGLYEIVASDSELAAVLAHEISHCVERDHYNVIRKQEMATAGKEIAAQNLTSGNDSMAGQYARSYAERHGATILVTSLDREAEYRSDEAAEVYLARAGMNPLALYSVMQKLTALGTESASLAALYKTHPTFEARLDRMEQRGQGSLGEYTTRE